MIIVRNKFRNKYLSIKIKGNLNVCFFLQKLAEQRYKNVDDMIEDIRSQKDCTAACIVAMLSMTKRNVTILNGDGTEWHSRSDVPGKEDIVMVYNGSQKFYKTFVAEVGKCC